MVHQSIHIFDLPAELRNSIYCYAVLEYDEGADQLGPRLNVASAIQGQPNVTRVSRRMREESLPLYYSANRFTLRAPDDQKSRDFFSRSLISAASGRTRRWLSAGTFDPSHLRQLTVVIGANFGVGYSRHRKLRSFDRAVDKVLNLELSTPANRQRILVSTLGYRLCSESIEALERFYVRNVTLFEGSSQFTGRHLVELMRGMWENRYRPLFDNPVWREGTSTWERDESLEDTAVTISVDGTMSVHGVKTVLPDDPDVFLSEVGWMSEQNERGFESYEVANGRLRTTTSVDGMESGVYETHL
ncbi:hypothetical protein LTS18_007548 [Coniosporium uncinatum]|uniref:Uncharacterized protein n=1 Tax=Coniosporium uncinatum TaxID=93489 RepID=A0ACC3DP68_9PEZI|nr:hypothetical protein LTS18_007548 [Coniosporium uncinatum]